MRGNGLILAIAVTLAGCSFADYTQSGADGLSAGEVAILENRSGCPFCIRSVTSIDQDGVSERVHTSPGNVGGQPKPFERYILLPGRYRVAFESCAIKVPCVRETVVVDLQPGHRYAVRDDYSTAWWVSLKPRMRNYSLDAWLEDLTTGENVGGCRQGIGCRWFDAETETWQFVPIVSRIPTRLKDVR